MSRVRAKVEHLFAVINEVRLHQCALPRRGEERASAVRHPRIGASVHGTSARVAPGGDVVRPQRAEASEIGRKAAPKSINCAEFLASDLMRASSRAISTT